MPFSRKVEIVLEPLEYGGRKEIELCPGTVLNGYVRLQYPSNETVLSLRISLHGAIISQVTKSGIKHRETIELLHDTHELLGHDTSINVDAREPRLFRFEFLVPEECRPINGPYFQGSTDERFANFQHPPPPDHKFKTKCGEEIDIVYSMNAVVVRKGKGASKKEQDVALIDRIPCRTHPLRSDFQDLLKTETSIGSISVPQQQRKLSISRSPTSPVSTFELSNRLVISVPSTIEPGIQQSCLFQLSDGAEDKSLRIDLFNSSWALHRTMSFRSKRLPPALKGKLPEARDIEAVIGEGRFVPPGDLAGNGTPSRAESIITTNRGEELCFNLPDPIPTTFRTWNFGIKHSLKMRIRLGETSSSNTSSFEAQFDLPIRVAYGGTRVLPTDDELVPNMRDTELPSYEATTRLAAPSYEDLFAAVEATVSTDAEASASTEETNDNPDSPIQDTLAQASEAAPVACRP